MELLKGIRYYPFSSSFFRYFRRGKGKTPSPLHPSPFFCFVYLAAFPAFFSFLFSYFFCSGGRKGDALFSLRRVFTGSTGTFSLVINQLTLQYWFLTTAPSWKSPIPLSSPRTPHLSPSPPGYQPFSRFCSFITYKISITLQKTKAKIDGRCVARSLRPSLRQKFHRRF